MGEGRVLLREGRVGDRGGRGGSRRSDLETGRWRFMSDLEISLGTSRYVMEVRDPGLEYSYELLKDVLD